LKRINELEEEVRSLRSELTHCCNQQTKDDAAKQACEQGRTRPSPVPSAGKPADSPTAPQCANQGRLAAQAGEAKNPVLPSSLNQDCLGVTEQSADTTVASYAAEQPGSPQCRIERKPEPSTKLQSVGGKIVGVSVEMPAQALTQEQECFAKNASAAAKFGQGHPGKDRSGNSKPNQNARKGSTMNSGKSNAKLRTAKKPRPSIPKRSPGLQLHDGMSSSEDDDFITEPKPKRRVSGRM